MLTIILTLLMAVGMAATTVTAVFGLIIDGRKDMVRLSFLCVVVTAFPYALLILLDKPVYFALFCTAVLSAIAGFVLKAVGWAPEARLEEELNQKKK